LTEWRYQVPPDVGVVVRARAKPKLLAHVLGPETTAGSPPSLVLDLASEGGREPERPLTVRGVYKAVPWSCRITRGGEGGWTLGFGSPIAREYLALHVALLPALRRLLLDCGVAFIGAAAFESGSGATVVAGLTGSGKTSLLLGALERGAAFIGDEYLGISERGDVTPVVRALALRDRTLALAPSLLGRLSRQRRVALRAASLAAMLTGRRLEPLVHLPPSELGLRPSGDRPVAARRLVWLERGAERTMRIEPLDVPEVIERLAIMQAMHDVAYGDLGALLDAGRGCAGTDYASRWRAVLERGLSGVSCYRLLVPARAGIPPEALERVLSVG
jgi:hypothetical protein